MSKPSLGTAMLHRDGPKGFSLVEILTVLAIIGILSALIIPSFNSIVSGQRLTSASQTVVDQMNLARSAAITNNRPVEFRFYNIDVESGGGRDTTRNGWSAVQVVMLQESGIPKALTKLIMFPPAVRFVAPKMPRVNDDPTNYSPLLAFPDSAAGPDPEEELPSLGTRKKMKYKAFQFRPDGSTSLRPIADKWFATLVLENQEVEQNGLQANYSTIQVDAGDGRVRVFRPGA